MAGQDRIRGVIAAIVTPVDGDEAPEDEALRAVVDHVLGSGVHGIMTNGGTGEFVHFTREERMRVTQVVVDRVAGRVPVVAGTAACGTREAIVLARDAAGVGADAVIVTAPYYFRLPDESLRRHFLDLADATPLPLFVYNNPLYTGNRLSPGLVAELGRHERIVGIKQSEPDFGQFVEAVRLAGQRITVMTGIDSQFYASLCVGGQGILSTAACLIPKDIVAIWDAFQAGDSASARIAHERVQPVNRFLEYDPGYVAPCKAGLEMLGIAVGLPSRPMPTLNARDRSDLRGALLALGYSV
jgi:4-hydroxy-tetrahydrodipicolinate synthase